MNKIDLIMDKFGWLSKKEVRDAVEVALPDICIGGDRTPSDETMKLFHASKTFLYEELGL